MINYRTEKNLILNNLDIISKFDFTNLKKYWGVPIVFLGFLNITLLDTFIGQFKIVVTSLELFIAKNKLLCFRLLLKICIKR